MLSSLLLPIRFPSTSFSRAASISSSPVRTRIRNRTSHLPAPPSRSMSSEKGAGEADVVVQYVVLRRDLIDTWPTGSVVAQGCHASVAAIWTHRDHPDTAFYTSASNIDSMHKVALEVKGEIQMRSLSEKLTAAGIEHKLWIEQPENIPTCLATRPYPRSQVASYFKKLKLCK